MRRLAAIGLLELNWKTESVEIKRTARTGSVRWDRDAGVYREVDPYHAPVQRAIERRAVRLTPFGAFVVDRLRSELERGKRIRWTSLFEAAAE